MPYFVPVRERGFANASVPATAATNLLRVYSFAKSATSHNDFPQDITAGLINVIDGQPSQQALDSLKNFVHRLLFLDYGQSAMAQIVVTTLIIAVLLTIGILLVAHRVYRRKFWVFRFTRRAEGIYIVPNALNCFLLLEGSYATLFIAYNLCTWQLFDKEHGYLMGTLHLWQVLTWIPLYMGAFWAGWGSFYTAPGALDRTNSTDRGRVDKVLGLVPKPLFINLVCLGTPILLLASFVPTAVLSQKQLNHAYDEYVEWLSFANSLSAADGTLTAASAQEVLNRANAVWNSVADSYICIDVAFALWSFWALVFLAFYIPAGGYLVFLLWKQVQKHKALLFAAQKPATQQAHSTMPPDSPQNSDSASDHTAHLPMAPRKLSNGTSPFDSPKRFQSLALGEEKFVLHERGPSRNQGGSSEDSSTAVPEEVMSPPSSPTTGRPLRHKVKEEVRHIFFPPLGPNYKRNAIRRLSANSSPSARFKYIRRCMVNLIILYLGIIAAAIIFAFIAIRLAEGVQKAILSGTGPVAKRCRDMQLLASYASCIFGGCTVGSIAFRDFDPDAPERDKLPFQLRRRNKRTRFLETSRKPSGESDGRKKQEEKTRTLPAVPESVGVETTIPTFSKSQAGDEQLVSGIKFSLATDSVHPGALVMRPDDLLASRASQTPETDRGAFTGASGSPGRSPPNGSPIMGGTSGEVKHGRKHSSIFGSRPQWGSGASKSRISEEPIHSFPQDEASSYEVKGPPSPQVFYATPYGPMPGPSSSSNGHTSLRSHSSLGHVARSASQSSLAQIAAKHAQEQLRQQAVQPPLPQINDAQPVGLLPSHELMDDGEVEEVAEPVHRRWLRRSSRSSSVSDTAASQIARDWQASHYARAELPQTPTTSSSRAHFPGAPATPVAAAASSLRGHNKAASSSSPFEGYVDVFDSPRSAHGAQFSPAEAMLAGSQASPATLPRVRRPSLPSQQRQWQQEGAPIVVSSTPPRTKRNWPMHDKAALSSRQSPGTFF
ncbi:hypothetical protein ACQY0O_003347 [Thecaphora frezii]